MKHVDRLGKRIAVDTIKPAAPARKHKAFEARFVQVSDYWMQQLERSNNPGTFKLAHRILRESFKRTYVGGEIILSTKATGLSRKVRSRAVKELVGLGLIQIDQKGNQAVRVTNILVKREQEEE